MPLPLIAWAPLPVLTTVWAVGRLLRVWNAPPLPPGPPGALPVLGHVLVMPQSHEWLTYQRWSAELGSDIICLRVMGRHMIILNSLSAVSDLLEGKASIYSDRPKLYALKELIGLHWLYGLMPYGKLFLDLRKAASKFLHSEPIKQYRPLELAAVRRCVQDLSRSPEDYVQHLTMMAGRTILGVAYGIEPSLQDSYMKNVYMSIQGLKLGLSPRALLYDLLPIIQWLPDWLPGLGVKKEARQYIRHTTELPELPLQATRAAMESGSAPTSIAASMLADAEFGHNVVRSLTGSMYFAGTETIVATLCTFILAMLKYPETQRKAQAEIDTLLQHSRHPDFSDEPHLPYVAALVKEVCRWRTATPLATPHTLTKDDIYNGLRIPVGAVIIGNVHAIAHDAALVGPNPDAFVPERYLDGAPAKELDVLFGFGPRICPGRHLARGMIWLAIASILAAFTISPAVDEKGQPVIVDDAYTQFTSGVVAAPLPFKCRIIPRAQVVETLGLGEF